MTHNQDMPKDQPESPTANAQKPRNWEKGLAVMNQGKPLQGKNKAFAVEVLQRYLSDESTKEIAASLNITRQALGAWLLQIAEDEWVAAQVARAVARKEKADEDMEVAADGLALARAREQLKSAQWDLEKLFRRLYGDKVQIEHGINLDTLDVLASASELLSQVRRRPERVVNEPQTLDLDDTHSIDNNK